jgi:hypothetical protein
LYSHSTVYAHISLPLLFSSRHFLPLPLLFLRPPRLGLLHQLPLPVSISSFQLLFVSFFLSHITVRLGTFEASIIVWLKLESWSVRFSFCPQFLAWMRLIVNTQIGLVFVVFLSKSLEAVYSGSFVGKKEELGMLIMICFFYIIDPAFC